MDFKQNLNLKLCSDFKIPIDLIKIKIPNILV